MDWYAVTHTILLQSVQDELALVELQCASRLVPFNSNTKQETSGTKLTTFEVLREELDIFVNCSSRLRSKYDIVNIDGNNNDVDLSIGLDVDRAVRFNPLQANSVRTECNFLFHCHADCLRP